MSAYPYLPLFTKDFLADTMHLSAQETGAYGLRGTPREFARCPSTCRPAGSPPGAVRFERRRACGGRAGCKLGKYVHHGLLDRARVEAALLEACRLNGVLGEDGARQCRDSLDSGLKKASGDGLPALQYWGKSTR